MYANLQVANDDYIFFSSSVVVISMRLKANHFLPRSFMLRTNGVLCFIAQNNLPIFYRLIALSPHSTHIFMWICGKVEKSLPLASKL